ncbi:M91 family zinc metallopeptidase, partial [Parabacteroides sp.]|uniref:M91 family zinc metallopeptidase n=1 Tax=Parabacteroides sp. TaxID=1869337 RepID=UPI0026E0BA9D
MKVEKQNKKQNLSLGDSEIVERKSSIIDNRPEAIMRRKMINDIRVTNKNTFIADNRLKIGIQRRVLNVINAPHSARSMRVIQRALWKYDGRQWECYKGEGSSISHIEGSTGNIYDDETETFYSDEAEYENVQGLLSELGALGFSGQLSILENDIKGTAYPDFKEKMIVSIKKLIQKELGRKLIMDIAKGGFAVTIRPSNEDTEPHANPTWREREETGNRTGERNEKEEPGEGVEATVVIPAAMDDSSFQCYNADFELCDEPLFVILGHELIHAYHMTKGEAYSNSIKPDTDPEYDNKEEEKTIATDPLFSENMIRTEHGFMPRFGHDGIEILDETIDLASSGVTKIREVIALFGISMDFLFEK